MINSSKGRIHKVYSFQSQKIFQTKMRACTIYFILCPIFLKFVQF